MLDVIPTTPAPRGASPAKAGQKSGDTPDAARFQQVYGKGETPQGQPQDQAAEERAAPEAPARKPAAPLEPAAPLLHAADAEALVPTAEEFALDQPEPDTTAETVTLPMAPPPGASPRIAPPPQPAAEQAAGTAPEQVEPAPHLQSTASPFDPPADDSIPTPNRAVAPADAAVIQDSAPTGSRSEQLVGGRDVDSRPGTVAAPSTDQAERQAAPRTEPTVAPAPRAAEAAAPRAVEAPVTATPAADPAPITSGQTAAPAPAPQPLQGTAPVAPPAAAVVEQLVVAAKQTSDGRVDLTLSPAELGRVRMTLLAGETGITVAIHADRDDTLDLFRRNSDALAQEFRQLGYGSVGFEFRGGGNSGQTQRPADEATENAVIEQATALPVGILRLTGIGGLDIRL